MALAGMSVTVATAVSPQGNGALPFNAAWSQLLASPGAFAQQVPSTSTPAGSPFLVRCWASADSWVAFSSVSGADALAKAQDPNVGPRWPVPGTNDTPFDHYAAPGSYVAWALA